MERAWARDSTALLFGTGEPSAIETAIGGRRTGPDWHQQVRLAIAGAFPGTAASWITGSLAPRPAPGPHAAGTGEPEPGSADRKDEDR